MPEVSPDFRVWTVRVKPGIYFQDDPVFKGEKRELVAADYVYSWKRFFDPRWKAPAFAFLNELKVLGMATLREAAVKGKTPFDYDTRSACARWTITAFRFGAATALPADDEWRRPLGCSRARGRRGLRRCDPRASVGTDRSGLPCGIRGCRRSPVWNSPYDAQPNADDAEGQALLMVKGRRRR
jgi:hypothetical protein